MSGPVPTRPGAAAAGATAAVAAATVATEATSVRERYAFMRSMIAYIAFPSETAQSQAPESHVRNDSRLAAGCCCGWFVER